MDGEAQKTSLFGKIRSFFNGVKAEYGKIIFPAPDDIKKQTVVVIVISVVIGVLILALDTIIKFGLSFIL